MLSRVLVNDFVWSWNSYQESAVVALGSVTTSPVVSERSGGWTAAEEPKLF